MDPFLMIFMPFERGDRELSNGTKLIKNGSILRKLANNCVGSYIASQSQNIKNVYRRSRYHLNSNSSDLSRIFIKKVMSQSNY